MGTPTHIQHTLYPLNDDRGHLTGVLAPMLTPLDTLPQWQAFTNGLISGLVSASPEENYDGLYSVFFHADKTDPLNNTLVIHRLSDGDISKTATQQSKEGYPDGTLGLLAIIKEPDADNHTTATLALAAGVNPHTKKMRSDRVLATIVNSQGHLADIVLDRDTKLSLRLLGKSLLKTFDNSIANKLN